MKQKIKLGIILGVEFVAITVILLLIFFAGKKSYTVTFDLNGGTLISGDLEQVVPQGKSATPPVVAKDGCYLHSWSASFHKVTRDLVIKAVWEWETSIGFDYAIGESSDYCEITGCFKDLVGDVYVGVYYDNKKVLGIRDEAFRDRDGITYIHMLDGILSIGERVFADCDALIAIELPGTLSKLGDYAFANCVSLKEVTLPDDLRNIGEGIFSGCTSLEKVVLSEGLTRISAGMFYGCTSLKEIVIPASVEVIEQGAFEGCTALEKVTFEVREDIMLNGEILIPPTDKPNTSKKVDTDKSGLTDGELGEDVEVVYSGLKVLKSGAFKGCSALSEIVLPVTLEYIEKDAFDSAVLVIKTPLTKEQKPVGWADGWNGEASVEWGYVAPEPEIEEEESEKHGWLS